MRAIPKIFLTLAVALNLVAAAMPSQACTKPCCEQAAQKDVSAGCESCEPAVELSVPAHRCCQVAADKDSYPVTLNTGARAHHAPMAADVSGHSYRPSVQAAPVKPDHAFGTFKSPPISKLTSTYRC